MILFWNFWLVHNFWILFWNFWLVHNFWILFLYLFWNFLEINHKDTPYGPIFWKFLLLDTYFGNFYSGTFCWTYFGSFSKQLLKQCAILTSWFLNRGQKGVSRVYKKFLYGNLSSMFWVLMNIYTLRELFLRISTPYGRYTLYLRKIHIYICSF